MVDLLWTTLDVQMFDFQRVRGVSADRRARRDSSVGQTPAERGRHVEGVADREPHVTGRDPGGDGLIGRALPQYAEDVVAGHRAGAGAEVLRHQGPELGHSHVDRQYRRPPGPPVTPTTGRAGGGHPGGMTLTAGSPLVTVLMIAGLLLVLALLIRQWRDLHRR